MTDFPYINSTGKLGNFFNKIQSMGVPDSVSTKWLPSIGFTSTNDRPIIKILKFIGFVTDTNKPTDRWQSFRDKNQSQKVMAQGILQGYSDLFVQYPDAYQRTDEDLKNFFRANSKAGEKVISSTLTTFKVLCSLADFSDTGENTNNQQNTNDIENQEIQSAPTPSHSSISPSLHIDIQIHIDSDATADQIDQIFASMAKHLYNKDNA